MLVALWAFAANAGAQEGRRVALIIGNSQYAELSSLPNPRNDARDIAAALGGIGFTVTLGIDQDVHGFAKLLTDFETSARGAEVALFFYAGHGVQLESENYLIPVDAKLDTRLALKRETFPLNDIMGSMSGAEVSLIFVDACRRFPIEGTFFATGNERITRVNGPAPVQAAPNSFIGFSASPGQVALDGVTANSPFASAMLEFLPQSGLSIAGMFTAVSGRVRDATRGAQVPQSWGTLSQPLALVPIGPDDPVTDPSPSAEERAYLLARQVGTEAAYIAFIARYPGGFFAELAKAELEKLRSPRPIAPPPQPEPDPEPLIDVAGVTARCDEIGADPYDADKVGPGVPLEDLDAQAAIAACREAVRAAGDDAPARLHYQLGRALQASGDVNAALASYESASRGSAEAKSQIGYILRDGTGGSLNLNKAIVLFGEAADAGSASAMTGFAQAYESGQGGLGADAETAADWYKRAANAEYPQAMHLLANMYRDGRGVAKNMQRAMQLYERARALGVPAAAYNLAWALDVADGVERNSRQAAKSFMQALASGEAVFVEFLQRDGKQLSPATRRALQQELKDGGFYSGAVDAAFGPGTNRAIAAAGLATFRSGIPMGVAAQYDLFVPSVETRQFVPSVETKQDVAAPPKPRAHLLAGSWYTVTRGSMICSFGSGTIEISADGKSGHADVGGFPGAVSSLRFNSPNVYLSYNYVDTFGGHALAEYEGVLSADKNTITGGVGGTWEDDCTFTMQRR